MPKLEPKIIQKELEQGWLWPVYWLYGTERMKSRELLKRIRKAVLGSEAEAASGLAGFGEESLDANEVGAATVLDAAQSLSLGGGCRFIVIREAHALKEAEILSVLCGPKAKKEDLTSVCVFLSKDLDGRKKFSKILTDKAAVVPCEEVPETEREAWIAYLAKRRGIELPPELVAQMSALDPWSLDIIDQELEKFSLAQTGDVILSLLGGSGAGGGERFLNAFFARDLKRSLQCVEEFADRPDESLPLLGLLGWNVRHLALVLSRAPIKLNPFILERLQAWSRHWELSEVIRLQSFLEELDFGMKQTPLLPMGLWSEVVTTFCRPI
jgi:DNA polymerase III delta subunit